MKTPDEVLDRFLNMKPDPQDPDPESAGMDGHADQAEYERQEALQGIADFCTWIVETADGQAKQLGYPGTGKVPPEKLGQLYAMVAERNMSDTLIKKSPEMMAASITVGILGVNFAHYRKQQLQQQKQNQETQDSQENE